MKQHRYDKKRFKSWKECLKHRLKLKSTSKVDKSFYRWCLKNNKNPF